MFRLCGKVAKVQRAKKTKTREGHSEDLGVKKNPRCYPVLENWLFQDICGSRPSPQVQLNNEENKENEKQGYLDSSQKTSPHGFSNHDRYFHDWRSNEDVWQLLTNTAFVSELISR
ncbi:predicted protein [Histoplasma capsulatum G186AR]|uniref:Uncharacterized protein n=1 Tax=Ajellomyces capsulatus (strain G186AR / H82 / ATCC MYA-2454 / RMSCC 2432) TaxID=447093 RepID=C0NLU1_AJECG|nr:uncharacterized protein HCBG_04471 [Histoplasma capsulatum G186AR]EEH07592.1 predicted protein [Histoplasma capsulatum G186AR]